MKFVLIFFILSSCSCSIVDNDDEYLENFWAGVEKVEVKSNKNGLINFNILLSIPTPCNKYDKREVVQKNDTLFVKYFSKVKKETNCVQVISSVKISDEFFLQRNKEYFFRFRKSDDTYLDTLIFID